MPMLSEMSNDRALNVMGAMAVELPPLLKDREFMDILGRLDLERREDEDMAAFGMRVVDGLAAAVPLLAVKYRPNLYRVLGAFLGIGAEEVGERGFLRTLSDVKAILSDGDVLAFFTSLRGRGRKEPSTFSEKCPDLTRE